MEEKRPGRAKRQPKVVEDGFWDCSVCTYKNSPEAYKCDMCDVRKGTSTRKPRINPQIADLLKAQQQFATPLPEKPPEKKKEKSLKRDKPRDGSLDIPKVPRLKNVDRTKASHMSVTVNNVTVVVTDYQPKLDPRSSDSHLSSDASDTNSIAAPDLNDDSSRDTVTT